MLNPNARFGIKNKLHPELNDVFGFKDNVIAIFFYLFLL